MTSVAFRVIEPDICTTGTVFASPHSGRAYDRRFLARSVLDERTIRSSEDAFVDLLFEAAPKYGAPLLLADVPRAFVDLNRAPDEFDPAVIDGVRSGFHNPRVSSGLGVVPRVVANGRAIYRGKLTLDEARARIRTCWRPYHDRLQDLLDTARHDYARALLIDCHSMPHEALEHARGAKGGTPEVVLGDRFGAAAAPDVMDAVEEAFTNAGLRVARNTPFAGAFVTQYYGRPSRRQHVVQIEIDRALYMNEVTITPTADFASLQRVIEDVIAQLCMIGRNAPSLPLAAE